MSDVPKVRTLSGLVLVTICSSLVVLQLVGSESRSVPQLTLVVYEDDTIYIPCLNFSVQEGSAYAWNISGEGTYTMNNPGDNRFPHNRFNGFLMIVSDGDAGKIFECHYQQDPDQLPISVVRLQLAERSVAACPFDSINDPFSPTLHLLTNGPGTVFLPCALNAYNEALVWSVNEVVYPASMLLSLGFIPFYNGLKMNPLATDSLTVNRNSIQCYSRNELVSTVNLLLCSKPDIQADYSQPVEVGIISQDVTLMENSKIFRFKVIGTMPTHGCDCGSQSVSFVLKTKNQTIIHTGTSPQVSIPSGEFADPDAYIFASAEKENCICALSNYGFRVDENVITTIRKVLDGGSVCISSQELLMASEATNPLLIWPVTPGSSEDCTCPVYQFADCYCLKLNLTTYQVKMVQANICWQNLTSKDNGTKVLIVEERIQTGARSQLLLRIRNQLQFIVSERNEGDGTTLQSTSQSIHNMVCNFFLVALMGAGTILFLVYPHLFIVQKLGPFM